MGIVDFNTSIWKDPWFRKLPLKAKILFIFLWTNDHKNLACIYEMDVETMSFYTGMGPNVISETIRKLYPKVKYDFDNEIVWVTNFVRHQFMRTKNISPKIVKGIENNLVQINGHFFIKDFLEEYQSLNITYPYPIDTLSEGYAYPPGEGKGEGKGNKGGKGGGETPQKEAKARFLEYVELLPEEFETLKKKYGDIRANKAIEVLNNYFMADTRRLKKYTSHYGVINSWVMDKVLEKMPMQGVSQIENIGITICRDCKKPSDTLTDGRCDSCIKECG